jgi:hypothetical protein
LDRKLKAFFSYQPSPFFVLDEVDAALDNTNVAKIANYIKAHASESFQFIVISLKGSLYERGHSLVGIYRDQDINSSKTLTLDVSFQSLIGSMHLTISLVDAIRRLNTTTLSHHLAVGRSPASVLYFTCSL